jgi:hypothetical protein
MASDEFLARIDAHMERGNELMEQIRAEHRLNRATYERILEDQERRESEYQQHLQITREVIRRNELAFQENTRVLAEVSAELISELRELGAEVRAQTQAIFRMLDRFDGGAEPAGA